MRTQQAKDRFFDDLARVAGSALRSLSGLRAQLRPVVESLLDGMDLVSREEFERVSALAARARERQDELEKRLTALEKTLRRNATAAKKKRGKA